MAAEQHLVPGPGIGAGEKGARTDCAVSTFPLGQLSPELKSPLGVQTDIDTIERGRGAPAADAVIASCARATGPQSTIAKTSARADFNNLHTSHPPVLDSSQLPLLKDPRFSTF